MKYVPDSRISPPELVPPAAPVPPDILARVQAEVEHALPHFNVVYPSTYVRNCGPLYLINPTLQQVRQRARLVSRVINAGALTRTVSIARTADVMAAPFGVLVFGHVSNPMYRTSVAALSWYTVRGTRVVRLEGIRSGMGSSWLPRPRGIFGYDEPDGIRSAFRFVFPHRAKLADRARRRLLEQRLAAFGPAGADDRLAILRPVVCARVRDVGMLLKDHLKHPKVAQVVVRDSTTGLRHTITVPPRFVDPSSATYQRLGTPAARIRGAIAWTFGLRPDEYSPDIEA